MKTNQLKYGLSAVNAYAPKWIINTSSVLALLIASKHVLVNNLPMNIMVSKLHLMQWVDYCLDILQIGLAIAVIFTAKNKQT